MKKLFSVFSFISLLAVLVPMVALAAAPVPMTQCIIPATDTRVVPDLFTAAECPATCVFETNKTCGMCCTLQAVYKVSDWIFIVLMVIVVVLILWGAFQIVTAAGVPEKVTSGRNFILYALIGLVVAFFARALPALVKGLIGA